MNGPSFYLALWVVLNLMAITAWDISITVFRLEQPTVSQYIYEWMIQWPLLALIIGIGIGHIFLPLKIRKG